MGSPAAAIGWEFRQRHHWGLIGLAAYLGVLATIKLVILARGLPINLESPQSFALVVVVPLSVTFTYALAVFSFGLSGDLAARQSMYPARMFTLPVTSAALAGWPDALRHDGHGGPVGGNAAARRVAIGHRGPIRVARAPRRVAARVDAGADMDAVRSPGAARARHRAVAGNDRLRRPAGPPLQGARALHAGDPGAPRAARVSRRPLRRGARASRRRARLAKSIRPPRPAREYPAESTGAFFL